MRLERFLASTIAEVKGKGLGLGLRIGLVLGVRVRVRVRVRVVLLKRGPCAWKGSSPQPSRRLGKG